MSCWLSPIVQLLPEPLLLPSAYRYHFTFEVNALRDILVSHNHTHGPGPEKRVTRP